MRVGMKERSAARMDEILAHYAGLQGVLAIAAFGSNANRERFDDYSDLDFLVLVTKEAKAGIIEQASKLESICPIDSLRILYGDAVQLLFSDGVFCDYGIVTPEQLETFPHGEGLCLFHSEKWTAVHIPAREPEKRAKDELLYDALIHLFVGLLRVARGEEAAAFEEIQVTAAKSVLTLLQGDKADAFSPLRRAERLLPKETLSSLMPGYGRSLEAAETMLKHLMFAKETPLFKAVFRLLNCFIFRNIVHFLYSSHS